MRIAYRRMSGAMPLSVDEKGSRGIWWEKRWGLIRALRERGHKIEFVSRISRASQAQWRAVPLMREHKLLMLEFGSNNSQFYGNDLAQTVKMLAQHQGQVIFLCDDPDLPFIWGEAQALDYSRWTCWYNATRKPQLPGQPATIPVVDFPFAALTRALPYTPAANPHLIYFGRPNGRHRALGWLMQTGLQLTVAGKVKEWSAFPKVRLVEPPEQPRRPTFYKQFRAALVLADSKHKAMGWRTGRAYHALAAGVPIFSESDHSAMPPASRYKTGPELVERLARLADDTERKKVWADQYLYAQQDRALCDDAFARAGL